MKIKYLILLALLFSFDAIAFEKLLKTGEQKSLNIYSQYTEADYRIDYTVWNPENFNNHVIIYAHGLQSHRGWFNSTAEKLSQKGFAIIAFDRIASGTSCGEISSMDGVRLKSHILNWETFVEVTEQVIGLTREEYPNSDLHLWANSYAAKIVTSYLLSKKESRDIIASTIFTTPGLFRNAFKMPVTMELLFTYYIFRNPERYFKTIIKPSKGDNGAHWFTSKPEYFAMIKNDKLSARKMTRKFLSETKAMDKFIKKKSKLKDNNLNGQLRFYLMVKKDRMMNNRKMKKHINRNPVNASFRFYQGGSDHKHLLFFTDSANQALDDITYFLLNNEIPKI